MLLNSLKLSLNQVILTILLCGLGAWVMLVDIRVGLFYTASIFIFTLFFGLWLCKKSFCDLNDKKLNILITLWLIKLSLVFILLHFGWIPELEATNLETWGFDPQRYYVDANDLILNDWIPTQSTNYQGIIYYYGVLFYIFGHNPIIPAIFNSFVGLVGVLFLIRFCYQIKQTRTNNDWAIVFVLLLPEFIWYDVMTSRETLLALLLVVSSLSIGRHLIDMQNNESISSSIVKAIVCLFLILAIRSTMAIPVLVSFITVALFIRKKQSRNWYIKLLVIGLLVLTLLSGPIIQAVTGGYDFDFAVALSTVQNIEGNVANEVGWTNNSVGLLLSPNNFIQSLFFTLPRMVLYLVSPLPNIAFSLNDLTRGSWSAWQSLMTTSSSVIYIMLFPFVLIATINSYRNRILYPGQILLVSVFWITFASIAGGNIIIHERYRIMMTPLFIACAWLGYIEFRNNQKLIIGVSWFGLLAFFIIFYMIYKMF